MRRKERQISRVDALAVLREAEYGVLSLASPEGEPYGIPLNFCLVDGAIYFHSATEGRKLDMLAHNSRVSFCAVGNTEVLPEQFGIRYESAIVTGTAREVSGSEKLNALEGLVRKYSRDHIDKGMEYISANAARTRVFTVVIEHITGKARR